MNHPSPFSRASLQLNVADLVVAAGTYRIRGTTSPHQINFH
ncbi:hypothetical protein LINPERHAP1_LOCUS10520 [Linum perenne]